MSYQRTCQGNCRQPEPPTDRCESILRLEPATTLTATVQLGYVNGRSQGMSGIVRLRTWPSSSRAVSSMSPLRNSPS